MKILLTLALLASCVACDPPARTADSAPAAPRARPAATRPAAQSRPVEPYEFRPGSPDGIGKWYMGREIAHVMGHQAAGWLERAEREEEERPSRLLQILAGRIKPDDFIADIGA